MKSFAAILFSLGTFLIGSIASSQAFLPMTFLATRHLTFDTPTETLYPNVCSTIISIRTRMGGVITSPWSYQQLETTLNFSTPAGMTVYSDAACTQVITSKTFSGWFPSSATFFVKTTSSGARSLTVSATGFTNAVQTYATAATNPFVWIGGTSNVWATNSNWSGGVAPNSTQVAYFDNTCTTFCSPTIGANIDVGGVRMMSNYPGTITQGNAFSITLGARGWVQEGGTFTGSSTGTAITGNGPFDLSGGTFTSTSGNLSNNY